MYLIENLAMLVLDNWRANGRSFHIVDKHWSYDKKSLTLACLWKEEVYAHKQEKSVVVLAVALGTALSYRCLEFLYQTRPDLRQGYAGPFACVVRVVRLICPLYHCELDLEGGYCFAKRNQKDVLCQQGGEPFACTKGSPVAGLARNEELCELTE